MKYIDEFRDKKLIKEAALKIREITPQRKLNLMEVCGTHTQSFFRFGLDKLLPENIRLISGPGCPVCVSAQGYIDRAISYAQDKDVIIATFGDMLRLPGSYSSLDKERAKGACVSVVYSALDSLRLARANPGKRVIFLAVGFETTAPTIALTILLAKKEKIGNLFFLSSLKLMPPAMQYLLKDKRLNINGFLCPGHVSAIIGLRPYKFIPAKYGIACVIAGFQPLDMLEGIYFLLRQVSLNKPKVENQYIRAVPAEGNPQARKIIYRVFETTSADWRGLGRIQRSGLKIKKQFFQFDAEAEFSFRQKRIAKPVQAKKCRCADVLKGLIPPSGCGLFAKACKPVHPVGPCMVSNEGACNAYYKYK